MLVRGGASARRTSVGEATFRGVVEYRTALGVVVRGDERVVYAEVTLTSAVEVTLAVGLSLYEGGEFTPGAAVVRLAHPGSGTVGLELYASGAPYVTLMFVGGAFAPTVRVKVTCELGAAFGPMLGGALAPVAFSS